LEYKRNQLPEPLDQTTYPSIIDVAQKLHGHVTGTSGGCMQEELEAYYNWLVWRINEGWEGDIRDRTWPNLYDRAVKQLCLVACHMHKINRTNKNDG
jgi:hypothetical protein